MKYLKQKLMAAAAMMLISVLMLSSASFAWFAISTAPEVRGVATSVKANQAFEIAVGDSAPAETKLGETGNGTWGATVKFEDADFTGATLGPAKIDGDALKTAEYEADGRPKGTLIALTWKDANDAGVSIGEDKNGNAVAFKLPIWLRSNMAGKFSLTVPEPTFESGSIDTAKILVAAQLEDDGTLQAVSADGTAAEIGEITAEQVGKAMKVNLYVYLDGEKVTNADIAAATKVTFDSITFTHDQIDGTSSYTPTSTTPPSTP